MTEIRNIDEQKAQSRDMQPQDVDTEKTNQVQMHRKCYLIGIMLMRLEDAGDLRSFASGLRQLSASAAGGDAMSFRWS